MKKKLLILALAPLTTYAGTGMDALTTDSTLDVQMTNHYFQLHGNEYQYMPTANAEMDDMTNWVQTLKVDYKSGYFSDVIGVDVGAYAVDDIQTGDKYWIKKYVKQDDNGEAEGFVKFHEANLKQKFKAGEFDVELAQGLKVLRDFGVVKPNSAATESSFFGYTGEAKSKDWQIKLGYLTELSDANSDRRESFYTSEGEEIDYIATADVTYKFAGNSIRYYIGESEDYLRRQYIGYGKFLEGKKLGVFFETVEGLSGYDAMSAGSQRFDDAAYHMGADMSFFFPKSFVKLAYTYTIADRDSGEGLGQYVSAMSAETSGTGSFAQGDARDYMNDGEHMVGFVAFHHFTDEVELGLVGRLGFGHEYMGEDLLEGEYAVVGNFKPKSIPNLELQLVYSQDFSYQKGFTNNPNMINGKTIDAEGEVVISKITYKF